MQDKEPGHRMWRGTYEVFQKRDQFLRLLQSIFSSSSGVRTNGWSRSSCGMTVRRNAHQHEAVPMIPRVRRLLSPALSHCMILDPVFGKRGTRWSLMLAQTPPDESMFEVKEENSVTFLVFKIHYNWPAVGWIQGEIVKRNVWSQDEDWIWHGQLLCFFQIRWWHPQALLNLSNYIKDGSPEAPHSDWVLLVDKEGMRETRVECFDEFTLVFLHMFEWFLFLHILTPETTPHPLAPP